MFLHAQDEWVVSRVFQKIGGGKKTRLGLAGPSNSDAAGGGVGSQSSSSLPLLLDSSPFAGAASSFASADRESCSYESTDREPVPCFSTTASHLLGNEATPPPLFGRVGTTAAATAATNVNVGLAFPCLRSLQENLQLPFFLSGLAPPLPPLPGSGSAPPVYGSGAHHREIGGAEWLQPADLERKAELGSRVPHQMMMPVGSTELDCLWTF